MKTKNLKTFILLHVILLVYSFGGIASKTAATSEFLSMTFVFFYGLMLFSLFIYAVFWQQILKKLPLTTAFANKSIVVVWGMIWGALIFKEEINLQKLIAAAIIIAGIFLVVKDD